MYSVLLENGKMAHPYYRMNEHMATPLSEKDCEMQATFTVTREMLTKKHVDLVFYGLDTLCDVYVNGKHMLYADNMHRTWRFDVLGQLKEGENVLAVGSD
jgi:beta-mannosidase